MSQAKAIIKRYKGEKSSLTHVLQEIQEHYYYLPKEALVKVSEGLGVPLPQVYSVATFYKAFSLTPRGKHLVNVCLGTACHVQGASLIMDKVARELGVEVGGTTADRQFTVEGVRCLGC
ncbi:MAG: NAD(P)H-dependent oxidoreductase subunit E, partial [Chloroflexota bacterium]|nr:NAD(P)H-dependent oxidoreductase subunit E [Chloroflexota bacterium]